MAGALKTKNLSLLVALASLLLALVLQLFFIDYFRNEEQYLHDITAAVDRTLADVEKESGQLTAQLVRANPDQIQTLAHPTDYAYYLFRQGKLVYWSDYRKVPRYTQLQGVYDYAYRTLSSGSYLVRRDSVPAAALELFMLVPVRQDAKISNQYVGSGFNPRLFPEGAGATMAASATDTDDRAHMISFRGEPLFGVTLEPPPDGYRAHPRAKLFQVLISALVALSIFLILLNLSRFVRHNLSRRNIDLAVLVFALALVSVRVLMLAFDFPYSVLPLQLFDYRYFASSAVNPSLGDLLLNCLLVLAILVFLFNRYYATHTYRRLHRAAPAVKSAVAVILFLSAFGGLYLHYDIIQTIYVNSQWTLDITKSLSFTFLKNVSLLIFIVNSVSFFLFSHMVLRIFISLSQGSYLSLRFHLLVSFLLALLISSIGGKSWFLVLLILLAYFALLRGLHLTKYLARARYITFLYVFGSTVVSAATCALVAYDMHALETEDNKQKFVNQLLVDNDVLGELLLAEARQHIEEDAFIRRRLSSPVTGLFGQGGDYDAVRQKIERIYLGDYFDSYDVEVYLFDSEGAPLEEQNMLTFAKLKKDIVDQRFETEYENLYFVNQSNATVGSTTGKRYYMWMEVSRGRTTAGFIIIQLTLKRFAPNRVYPELLVDQTYSGAYPTSEYDYAVYSFAGEQRYNNGDEASFQPLQRTDFAVPAGSGRTISRGGYSYLLVEGKDNSYIAIASPAYSLVDTISNFSFLFLLLVFTVLCLLVAYSVYFVLQRKTLNFATKIQLYLNAAFFMPLLAVSVTTLSIISNSYNEETDQLYSEKALQIGNNVTSLLEQYQQREISRERLANSLAQVARYAETDVNVFDTLGRLVVTSQPEIYEANLLSEYINPQALISIGGRETSQRVLEESVGSLSYKSSYAGLKSPNTGQLLGILSIPFFESRNQVEAQIIQVLTNMMNIFTFVFIVFLIISYLASVLLTYPLKYITQKLKRTSLSDYNEPLSWKANDEIGLMVGEYNRMLVNLEASRAALARTEKESAWREMAKQVAHEIKNPLTPMKLSLQHLKRRLQHEYRDGIEADDVPAMEKPVDNLLHQVDTLNDIASSFSSFAQMPVPKSEPYELSALLRKTVGLFEDGQQQISLQVEQGNLFVVGDEQLMGRILSNLIINAKQSVPNDRTPEVVVTVQRAGTDRVILKVRDNGTGISREIQHKVFMPNFSTKYAGSGIGLAIAKRGIEHAGGRITFDSQEDIGTTFYVELPLVTGGLD